MQENNKYDYLNNILEEEFPETFWRLHETGLLETEINNLLARCEPVFEEMGFDEDDRFLQYAVIGTIGEYLEEQATSNVVK